MSILNHFSRIQPARQEKEDEKDVPPEIDAESFGDDSDFDPAPKPANPRKRSANPQNETTNDEKAKVVKWTVKMGKMLRLQRGSLTTTHGLFNVSFEFDTTIFIWVVKGLDCCCGEKMHHF